MGTRQQSVLDDICRIACVHEYARHLGPVESRLVGSRDLAVVARSGGGHHRALHELCRLLAERRERLGPVIGCRVERAHSGLSGLKVRVRMNPHEQGRFGRVRNLRTLGVGEVLVVGRPRQDRSNTGGREPILEIRRNLQVDLVLRNPGRGTRRTRRGLGLRRSCSRANRLKGRVCARLVAWVDDDDQRPLVA